MYQARMPVTQTRECDHLCAAVRPSLDPVYNQSMQLCCSVQTLVRVSEFQVAQGLKYD